MPSSIVCKPRPTTTTQTSAAPFSPGPRPCDASCQKSPPDASQDLFPPPQPIEKEELKTRCLLTPHPTKCVTRPPAPIRVTHLAENTLSMRHPTPPHLPNLLKQRSLKPGVYELHSSDNASPGSAALPVRRSPSPGSHTSPPVAAPPRVVFPAPGPRPPTPGPRPHPPTLSHSSEIAYNDKGDYDP
jgi:hypothetical protein